MSAPARLMPVNVSMATARSSSHPAREAAVRAALEIIDALDDVVAPTRLIRIEEGL